MMSLEQKKITTPLENQHHHQRQINNPVGINMTVLPHYYNGIIVCVIQDQNSIYNGRDVVTAIVLLT